MIIAMRKKALRVIPSVTNETWGTLDIVSKWLISSRAAVPFKTIALMPGHALNNLFNNYTDYVRESTRTTTSGPCTGRGRWHTV
jgi:hypothetical protein